MHRSILACVTALAVSLVFPTAGWAVLSLELSSSDDLLNLGVGDTATIEVSLAGLDTTASQELTELTGSVLFPGSILGTPTNVTPGAIVPNAGDFLDLTASGQTDGFFLTVSVNSADHITTNGVFFRFDVTAITAGSDVFAIDPLGSDTAEQFNPSDPNSPIIVLLEAGADLPFTVQAAPGGAVPEPLTAGLSVMGLTALALSTTRRTKRS